MNLLNSLKIQLDIPKEDHLRVRMLILKLPAHSAGRLVVTTVDIGLIVRSFDEYMLRYMGTPRPSL